MLISVVHEATWGHNDVHVPCCHSGPCCAWLCSPTTSRVHADVCSLCYYLRPSWCPWSGLQPESVCWCPWVELPLRAVIVSLVCAVTTDYVDVCGLFCLWRPCWGQWYLLIPKNMWMSRVHFVTGTMCKSKHYPCCCLLIVKVKKALWQWYWWLQTNSWEGGP